MHTVHSSATDRVIGVKKLRTHRKDEHRSVWQAARLEGKVRNVGINPVRKAKKSKAK